MHVFHPFAGDRQDYLVARWARLPHTAPWRGSKRDRADLRRVIVEGKEARAESTFFLYPPCNQGRAPRESRGRRSMRRAVCPPATRKNYAPFTL